MAELDSEFGLILSHVIMHMQCRPAAPRTLERGDYSTKVNGSWLAVKVYNVLYCTS